MDGVVKITDFGLSKQQTELDECGNMELTSQVWKRIGPRACDALLINPHDG